MGFKGMGHEWHLARLCSPYTSTPVAQWLLNGRLSEPHSMRGLGILRVRA